LTLEVEPQQVLWKVEALCIVLERLDIQLALAAVFQLAYLMLREA